MDPYVVEAPPPWYRGGTGEPLLLLHGGGGTWRQWVPTIPELEREHDVLALTLPGHWGGPPIARNEEVTISSLANGAQATLDRLNWDLPHVAAASLGTWVAFELAKRGRARSLVAIAPIGGWGREDFHWRAIDAFYRLLRRAVPLFARSPRRWSTRPRLRRLLYWHHSSHPERMTPDYCATMLLGFTNCVIIDDFLGWARDHGGPRDLDQINCPVRLVFPARDRILPRSRHSRPLLDAIPGVEVVDLPGAGHLAMCDEPALVAKTIIDLTRSIGSGFTPERS